ncbi:MAG: alpha/beta hydrolase [Ruminococcus sp.]|nr:alpha/beta hydrolase [Ruminococcus sp.]
MKKALKLTGKIILGLLILLAILIIIMTLYNQIMLRKNKDLYETPLGQLVEVDGHNMSIYTEGEGKHTIVFMSGWGTSSPILDFKSLYSRLSDENRIAVVEKFGYGFSDIVDSERDFDTILRQDREALQKAGVKAPYVLCAHSLSGYEATLWAQKYPDEVEAIVGLDMCTANSKSEELYKKEQSLMKLAIGINKFEKATGLIRIGSLDQSGTLSEEENKIMTEICCHKLLNETIMNEGKQDIERAVNAEINGSALPTVPMILYLSPDSTQYDESWEKGAQAMADASSDGQLIKLDCGHYVHDFEYERIGKDMKELVEGLD